MLKSFWSSISCLYPLPAVSCVGAVIGFSRQPPRHDNLEDLVTLLIHLSNQYNSLNLRYLWTFYQTFSKRPPGSECRSHDFFPMIQHTQLSGLDFLQIREMQGLMRGSGYLVTSLRKCLHSASSLQGSPPSLPMPPALSTATIMSTRGGPIRSQMRDKVFSMHLIASSYLRTC